MATEPEPHTSLTPEGAVGQGGVESREETVRRAVAEQREIVGDQHAGAGTVVGDPSTRRGFNRALGRRSLAGALVGLVVGGVLGFILVAFIDTPLRGRGVGAEDPGALGNAGDAVHWIIVIAVAFAVIGAMLTTFINLEREDGRVEREVEQAQDRPGEGPGSALDPEHDVPTDRG